MQPYKLYQPGPAVTVVEFGGVAQGWQQWFMLSSDRHHDSPHCDREKERAHLEKAREREALIVDAGDLLDAMQGRFDPRRNMNDVRPEDAVMNYYDRVVDHAVVDYTPYAANWLLQGKGNHEMSVLKHTNHDLLSSFVSGMHAAGSGCILGGYGGWLKIRALVNKTKSCSINLKYFHGAGGGGPVTRGVIQSNRQSVYLPDADIVLNGHTHDAWLVPIARERVNDHGRVITDLVWHVRSPGYKDEYGDGREGWAVETWKPPKPLGCVWLRVYLERVRELVLDVECVLDV